MPRLFFVLVPCLCRPPPSSAAEILRATPAWQQLSTCRNLGPGTRFHRPQYISILLTQMLHAWNIYLHDWAIFGVNVGKYSSTMEHLGKLCHGSFPLEAQLAGDRTPPWRLSDDGGGVWHRGFPSMGVPRELDGWLRRDNPKRTMDDN